MRRMRTEGGPLHEKLAEFLTERRATNPAEAAPQFKSRVIRRVALHKVLLSPDNLKKIGSRIRNRKCCDRLEDGRYASKAG